MEFKLKGWSAFLAVVAIVGVAAYFKFVPGAAPSAEEIKAKLGDQLVTQIKADMLVEQQQRMDASGLVRELKRLDKIVITSIQARRHAGEGREWRKNLLHRPDRYLIKVDYTVGDSKSPRSLTLELQAPLLGQWRALPTPLTF